MAFDLSTIDTPPNTHATVPADASAENPPPTAEEAEGTKPLHPSVSNDSIAVVKEYNLPISAKSAGTIVLNSRLIPLQQWEGWVTSINTELGTFTAILEDLESGGNPDNEAATFPIGEVEADDKELFEVGSVFRWIVGYRDQLRGKRERVSSLYFRRRPNLSKQYTDEIDARAERLANALGRIGNQKSTSY